MGRNSQRQAFEKEGQVFTKSAHARLTRRRRKTPLLPEWTPVGIADAGIAARAHRPRPRGGSRASSQKTRIDRAERQNWSRFLWLMLGLLIVNWLLSSLFIGATSPATISYSFFSTQVRSGNVQSVTSTGDTIQGTFRHEVAYPSKVGERPAVCSSSRPSGRRSQTTISSSCSRPVGRRSMPTRRVRVPRCGKSFCFGSAPPCFSRACSGH